MTDPDPAGALASSPRQQEEEDLATRVEPLEAGIGGQELPQRGQLGEVTAAKLTDDALRALLYRIVTGDGQQLENIAMTEDEWNEGAGIRDDDESIEISITRADWFDLIRAAGGIVLQPTERPPARSFAVDPSAQPQERRHRAMDSPSDPDLGAALGRLPRERDEALNTSQSKRAIDAIQRAEKYLADELVGGSYGETECEAVIRGLLTALEEPQPRARTLRKALRRAQQAEAETRTLRADVARLRHLAHQLEGYAKHKPECQASQPDLSSGCPLCRGEVMLNYDGDSAICDRHDYVKFFAVGRFPVGTCTCGLAALTEPPA